MGASQKFSVEWVDGRVEEVTTDGRDWAHYEDLTDESAFPLLTELGSRFTSFRRLAWAGMRRQGMFDGDLDEFNGEAVSVLPESSDPTEPPGTHPEE